MATTNDSLRITQFVPSKREQVFRSWTDSKLVNKWLCPEECQVISNNALVAVGGRYRESMKCGDNIHTVSGTYREIIPNRRLVFTHKWMEPDAVETAVTVEFTDKDGGCEVTLIQKGFTGPESAKGHEQGWSSALRNLAGMYR